MVKRSIWWLLWLFLLLGPAVMGAWALCSNESGLTIGRDELSIHKVNVGDDFMAAFKKNPKVVKAWGDLFDFPNLRRNVGALEAKSLPKGSRPDPSTYLDAGYNSNNISKFDGGVVKIFPYTPSGTIGPPGGTFVLPKSQVDDLISQSNGSVSKLEELLGLDPGYLGATPNRIDIPNPSGTRMPSGNELGSNDNRIPGGQTSGSIFEATVDLIKPGTYTWGSIF